MKARGFYNIAADCAERRSGEGGVAVALVPEDGRGEAWTFAELRERARQAAYGLRRTGLKRGQRFLLKLPNGLEFPAAFLGGIILGAIPIPVSTLLTASEMRFLKEDSGARLVLEDPALVRRWFSGPALSGSLKTRASDPAFWLYTSGTEGRPKAVIHAHRSIPAHDARNRLWLDLRKGDVVFNTSALNWSYALTCGFLDALRGGASSVIFSGKADPEKILRTIQARRVTVFLSVPGIYRRLTECLKKKPSLSRCLRSVRVALSAGEKLPPEIRARFRKASGLTLREGLGMTEHSVYLVQPKGRRVVEGSCGRSLAGRKVTILREDLKPVRPGEVGILASHRSCAGLMLGYHRRPEEEKKVFRKDWFLSGDFAYRDAKGNFFYVGRRDDVITAGGYRISPMEVEAVLNRYPAVRESAVTGVEISSGKTIVLGHVAVKKGRRETDFLKRAILNFSRKRLARYKTPREIVFVPELPKTSNGKVQRSLLRR
ncbi:MAG TPA: AMP-binding protein [bacterium]|nr:AMP-binding protein [bacterium]